MRGRVKDVNEELTSEKAKFTHKTFFRLEYSTSLSLYLSLSAASYEGDMP